MASTLESSPNSPPTGGLVSFPAHVIWTNKEEERFFHPKAPPKHAPEPLAGSISTRPASNISLVGTGLDPVQRVHRLERSLRFLKTEHQKMLADLHTEMEKLRARNKDLQFQLVVGKPLAVVVEAEETTLDDRFTKSFDAVATQTEDPALPPSSSSRRFSHLEEELSSLRQALEDAESRNLALSSLLSQLKRSHIKLKSSSTVTRRQFLDSVQDPVVPTSYAKRFEEYEETIRRLRRENVEQKNELHHVRSSLDVYRGLRRAGPSTKEDPDVDKLPLIAVPPAVKPNNQARKTTALPSIHPHYLRYDGLASRAVPLRSTSERHPRASTFAGPFVESKTAWNDSDDPRRGSRAAGGTRSESKRIDGSRRHNEFI